MPIDNNHVTAATRGAVPDGYLEHDEDRGHFEPASLQSTPGVLGNQQIISDAAAWLQEAPRTSLSIIFRLFPESIRRMSDFAEQAELIGAYLWEAGYTAKDTDTCNPTWHWLEGQV